MIHRPFLAIDDIVKIDDALNFPISAGKVGRVVRVRDTGMFDVELDRHYRITIYANECEILSQKCVELGCHVQTEAPIRGRCSTHAAAQEEVAS